MVSIAVIGGGAAGLLCAGLASDAGTEVTLFEKNKSERKLSSENFYDNAYLGKKLLITGKGRCNVTNNCSLDDFLKNITGFWIVQQLREQLHLGNSILRVHG